MTDRTAPTLSTSRLRLRAHRPEDLAACAAMWANPAVVRFIGGRPLPKEDVWTRLLRYVGHWSWLGYGYWALEETVTGTFIGELGFADFKREMTPSLDGMPELGWALVPSAHGRGYATEAVKAAIAWGDARFPGGKTVCLIDPGNRASIRVAEKCGFQEQGRTTYRGAPTVLYSRVGSPP